jgi:hypothetical protein
VAGNESFLSHMHVRKKRIREIPLGPDIEESSMNKAIAYRKPHFVFPAYDLEE